MKRGLISLNKKLFCWKSGSSGAFLEDGKASESSCCDAFWIHMEVLTIQDKSSRMWTPRLHLCTSDIDLILLQWC